MEAWALSDVLSGRSGVTLNGERVDPDPELPLVAGDNVVFS
jgi:3D (Asp-Asp-Asp) domain-containing protein